MLDPTVPPLRTLMVELTDLATCATVGRSKGSPGETRGPYSTNTAATRTDGAIDDDVRVGSSVGDLGTGVVSLPRPRRRAAVINTGEVQ